MTANFTLGVKLPCFQRRVGRLRKRLRRIVIVKGVVPDTNKGHSSLLLFFISQTSHTSQDAHIDYANDVAEIVPKSGVVDIYGLTDKPGGYGRLKRYERLCLVGG
jgi:hypothetical protein